MQWLNKHFCPSTPVFPTDSTSEYYRCGLIVRINNETDTEKRSSNWVVMSLMVWIHSLWQMTQTRTTTIYLSSPAAASHATPLCHHFRILFVAHLVKVLGKPHSHNKTKAPLICPMMSSSIIYYCMHAACIRQRNDKLLRCLILVRTARSFDSSFLFCCVRASSIKFNVHVALQVGYG